MLENSEKGDVYKRQVLETWGEKGNGRWWIGGDGKRGGVNLYGSFPRTLLPAWGCGGKYGAGGSPVPQGGAQPFHGYPSVSYTHLQRISFSTVKNRVPYPDLLEVQLKSFRDFFQMDTTAENRKNEGLYRCV